ITMPSEDYKALTLRLYAAIGEVFRTGDSGLLDPLLAPDMIDHTPASGPVVGREPGKQLIASFAHAFPDTTLTVDLIVAEADFVAAFVSYRSTHWPIHGTSTYWEIGARHRYGYYALPRWASDRTLEPDSAPGSGGRPPCASRAVAVR